MISVALLIYEINEAIANVIVPENAAKSHTSGARFVGRTYETQDEKPQRKALINRIQVYL
jgi:hypothetical protein